MGCEVRYAKDDGSSRPSTVTLDAGTNDVVLRDLEYFTRYKVVVCARTSKGCGKEYSDIAYTFGDGEKNVALFQTNEFSKRIFQVTCHKINLSD